MIAHVELSYETEEDKNRLCGVRVGGQPVNPARTYKVVTSDFLHSGGDHLEPAYRNTPWRAGPGGLVESERATDECILLPLFHELTTADQERVVETLLESL